MGGAPHSEGVVADLGGASLELIQLANGGPTDGVSLPLGPFSLVNPARDDADANRRQITQSLAPIAEHYRADTLSAVGGAWRSLALLHMKMTSYPLEIVHQYEMSRRETLDAARFVARQSKASLERIEGISKRRVETLPHAALMLECLVDVLSLDQVVISAYGLREGLLFDDMEPAVLRRDPLVEGCAALTARLDFSDGLGEALSDWISPAFDKLEPLFGARDATLVTAACELADLGARLHPDHRADLVFDQVLRAPISGVSHAERAFLACACFARHTAAQTVREPSLVMRLLSLERLQRARALGAAIRLGCDLSGRTPDLLTHAQLDFKPDAVVLRAEARWAPMLLGEQSGKRALALAAALDRELKIRPWPAKQAQSAPRKMA
jgi:exopolyphosphatase/guanosine-5'-triphosphate,3'-diphosphate pyrophosphatase